MGRSTELTDSRISLFSAQRVKCALSGDCLLYTSPDRKISMTFIPEGDLYRLIVHSKLPSAEQFERWVFDEVRRVSRHTYNGG